MSRIDEVKCNCQILLRMEAIQRDENSCWQQFLLVAAGGHTVTQLKKGGWVGAFYPRTSTKKLPYYSKFFSTVKINSTFCKKFYRGMTSSAFRWDGFSYARRF